MFLSGGMAVAQGTVDDYRRAYALKEKFSADKVFYSNVNPQWIEGTHQFWYVRNTPDGRLYVSVDADKKARKELFDSHRLAKALGAASGKEVKPQALALGHLSVSKGLDTLRFVFTPMVHWPEVIMTYDDADKVLFSADAFGKFGALDVEEPWLPEARRYFIGIVGKYGVQVQAVLKKAAALDIETVCSLHGPVLHKEQLGDVLAAYDTWSAYRPETEGVLVAYSSIYGHTAEAAHRLAEALRTKGQQVVVMDLARCDMAEAVAQAFRFSKLVLATPTYNADVFPFMKEFIHHLTERNYQNRTVAFIENGSWAPMAAKVMTKMLEGSKNLTYAATTVTVRGALNAASEAQLAALADELSR